MKTYIFYYCDSLDSYRQLDHKKFSTSASTYSIASYRFISFYSKLDCEYINFLHFYRVINSTGKSCLRSFKTPDIMDLSKITTNHNNKVSC